LQKSTKAARAMIGKKIQIYLCFYFATKTGLDKINSDSYSEQTIQLENEHKNVIFAIPYKLRT